MAKRLGKRTTVLENDVYIASFSSAVGPKESEGPLAKYFDKTFQDELLGQNSFEKAESQLQKISVSTTLKKAGLSPTDIDMIFAGDLLNQCIGSAYGLRELEIPFLGLYGACSTMALSLILAATAVESGAAEKAVAVTSSHFCSSERQFRFPLEYGGQRPPTAQWTVTGSGSALLSRTLKGVKVKSYTVGRIVDLDVTDMNNMGAAMAPDDVKIRPYPKLEGMVFFYTQINIKGGGYDYFGTSVLDCPLFTYFITFTKWNIISGPSPLCSSSAGISCLGLKYSHQNSSILKPHLLT